jgi:heme oxygenase
MAHPSLASHTPTLMAQLRDATAAVREPLGRRVSWRVDYRRYLLRMYGFHAGLERALMSSRPLATVVTDAALRNHKAALLAHDLVVLGVAPRELAELPRLTCPAQLALAEALGWTYVVESLTLGGKQLAHQLARRIPAEIQRASAYLRCYGDEVPERWRALGVAFDGSAQAQAEGDRVIAAAHDGFLELGAWLRPALPPQATRIHA